MYVCTYRVLQNMREMQHACATHHRPSAKRHDMPRPDGHGYACPTSTSGYDPRGVKRGLFVARWGNAHLFLWMVLTALLASDSRANVTKPKPREFFAPVSASVVLMRSMRLIGPQSASMVSMSCALNKMQAVYAKSGPRRVWCASRCVHKCTNSFSFCVANFNTIPAYP